MDAVLCVRNLTKTYSRIPALTNISFDENSVLEKIGMNAFSCTSLRKVSIPDSVKVIFVPTGTFSIVQVYGILTVSPSFSALLTVKTVSL